MCKPHCTQGKKCEKWNGLAWSDGTTFANCPIEQKRLKERGNGIFTKYTNQEIFAESIGFTFWRDGGGNPLKFEYDAEEEDFEEIWEELFGKVIIKKSPIFKPVKPIIDPFSIEIRNKRRRGRTGRGAPDRASAPANAGQKNEIDLSVYAKQHVPAGQRYEHYSRTDMNSLGHDAAYVWKKSGKVELPIEYKSTSNFRLTRKQYEVAMGYYNAGRKYMIVTPKGFRYFNPNYFAPTGEMDYVGIA